MEKGGSKRRRERRREKRETVVGGIHQPALENAMAEPQNDTAVPGMMVNTDKLLVYTAPHTFLTCSSSVSSSESELCKNDQENVKCLVGNKHKKKQRSL